MIRKVGADKTPEDFAAHLREAGATIGFDRAVEVGPAAPLARPLTVDGHRVGNRFCVLPMEGWDGSPEGAPSELTRRRWARFGTSGAKLVWGGEAVAVRPDGRANPHQLTIGERNLGALAALRAHLVEAHEARFGGSDDLLVGLQLTHSGRFCRPAPDRAPRPRTAYRHPVLDARQGLEHDRALLSDQALSDPVFSDEELDRLVEDFVRAGVRAQRAGFAFVDVKHCHGYLGHELLSAFDRPGRYGGSLENRTRFLREVVQGLRAEAPGLSIGVRLSAFDFAPFRPGAGHVGEPEVGAPYPHAFGGDGTGVGIDLREPLALLDQLRALEISLVCVTAGSPYYNPHIQRPALYPPSDGYLPPEDPLVGVARQLDVTARLKRERPALTYVGSAYSYLQEWLPHVAQHEVRTRRVDCVGIGRLALSYPELCADVLEGRPLDRRKICRTFSDCTTAPRIGLVSGCYPLDATYKDRPEHATLKEAKRRLKTR